MQHDKIIYTPVKVVRDEAEKILTRGIHSKEDLGEVLKSLFSVQEKIAQVNSTAEKLAKISSELNSMAANYANANPSVMDKPLTEVKPGIRQAIVNFDIPYILTESSGKDKEGNNKVYSLWGRVLPQVKRPEKDYDFVPQSEE